MKDSPQRKYVLRAKYGMSLAEYEDTLTAQEYRCAICYVHIVELTQYLHVDHDHITGKVRGLLCGNCNMGIGQLKNIDNLVAAIAYLEKSA